jgi:hypothetical protein
MTVAELLEAIIAAYPGASAEALRTFKPVFQTRLRYHEGQRLADAATAVLGTFSATARKPFPICADFEAHLPSGKLHLPSDGPAIDFAGHRQRKQALVADWQAGQGAKIKGARGPAIFAHCLWEAQHQAGALAWHDKPARVILSADQIQKCEQQAVSTARMSAHGASLMRHGSNADWDDQMARCRALLVIGKWPKRMDDERGDGTVLAVSPAMVARLAQLAKARRHPHPAPHPEHEARAQ